MEQTTSIPETKKKTRWGWYIIDGMILTYSGINSHAANSLSSTAYLIHASAVIITMILAPKFFYWVREEDSVGSSILWGFIAIAASLFLIPFIDMLILIGYGVVLSIF